MMGKKPKFKVGEVVEMLGYPSKEHQGFFEVTAVTDDLGWRYHLRSDRKDEVGAIYAPESNLRKTTNTEIGWAHKKADLANAPAQADAEPGDFYAEFDRGWDMATRSMIDILERALNAPVAGDRLSHLTALVQNFRKEYPKHAESAQGEGGE